MCSCSSIRIGKYFGYTIIHLFIVMFILLTLKLLLQLLLLVLTAFMFMLYAILFRFHLLSIGVYMEMGALWLILAQTDLVWIRFRSIGYMSITYDDKCDKSLHWPEINNVLQTHKLDCWGLSCTHDTILKWSSGNKAWWMDKCQSKFPILKGVGTWVEPQQIVHTCILDVGGTRMQHHF